MAKAAVSNVNQEATYDVYLSYHWRDHDQVERVAHALKTRDLRVFLDRWHLVPGQPWQQALEAHLQSSSAVAVFVGPEGFGSWQQREKEFALDLQSRNDKFALIPVLLPGAQPALDFLMLNTWVDLREGQSDLALDTLASAIRGEALGPDQRARVEAARSSICPFRGLLPFREEDAQFFSGRAAFTQRLLKSVSRHSLVALVGASGSGKSSVARAGLIPALREGAGGEGWEIASMLPTDNAIRSLVSALVNLRQPDLPWEDRLPKVGKITNAIRDGSVSLTDLVSEVIR